MIGIVYLLTLVNYRRDFPTTIKIKQFIKTACARECKSLSFALSKSTFINSKDMHMTDSNSMWTINQGRKAKVSGFVGVSAAYLRRMREIGIDVGAEIICLNKPPFSAPRQFQICDGVFSLDKDIADSIMVAPC